MKEFNYIWRAAAKIKFPEPGLCFDYFFDVSENKWSPWKVQDALISPSTTTDSSPIFSSIYVPTLHTTRLKFFLDIHLSRKKPILFVGFAGTGKSAIIREYLHTTKADEVSHKTINFSSYTDSLALQTNIESFIEKKSGRTYGSVSNKTLVCFIDDFNMPYVDKYGTQSPVQLLRLILDHGVIFNRDQLEEKKFL